MEKVKLKALMSLPARAGREALKRGATFEADPQEARDLVRMGQAEMIKTPGAAAQGQDAK